MKQPIPKTFADFHRLIILDVLSEHDISISEVADVAGISRPQLNSFLSGARHNITTQTLDHVYGALCDMLVDRGSPIALAAEVAEGLFK